MTPALTPAALFVSPVEDPVPLLAAYGDAIGAAAMRDAYGPHWPRPALDGEAFFEFRAEDNNLIGWGSLLPEPAERVLWHSHGIFPSCQGAGWTPMVSRWLRAWAFEHSDCVAVGAKILDTNPRYQAWMLTKNPNPGWVYAGHLTLPGPGYDVYSFSRAYWAAHESPGYGPLTETGP